MRTSKMVNKTGTRAIQVTMPVYNHSSETTMLVLQRPPCLDVVGGHAHSLGPNRPALSLFFCLVLTLLQRLQDNYLSLDTFKLPERA